MMERFEYKTKEDYFKTQIAASKKKFNFCKVSIPCVERFREIILRSRQANCEGPILCLATRNGREVDIFRNVFFGSPIKKLITKLFERRRFAFSSYIPFFETAGRSSLGNIGEKSVVGVELNPEGKREDVLTGSFDDLPQEWTSKFNIIYSNSLDHAFDPAKAAKEWYRVVKPGGYIIIGFPDTSKPTNIDPVGNITVDDVRALFPGELIYYNAFGNAFRDAIIKRT